MVINCNYDPVNNDYNRSLGYVYIINKHKLLVIKITQDINLSELRRITTHNKNK